MSFREHMEQIVNGTPGAIAGVVMGFDGIPIDSFETSPGVVDTNTLLTEYAAATQQAKRVSEMLPESGEVYEVSIASNSVTALFRMLTDEYFIAVILEPGGITGKALRARRFLTACVPHGPDNPAIFYNAACVHMELGEHDMVLTALAAAIENGYTNIDGMRNEALFAPIADTAEFIAVFAGKNP